MSRLKTDKDGFLPIREQVTPGQRLRFLRLSYRDKPKPKAAWTQRQFATYAKYDTDSVRRAEADEPVAPQVLLALCAALGLADDKILRVRQEKWNRIIEESGLKARSLQLRSHAADPTAERTSDPSIASWVRKGIRRSEKPRRVKKKPTKKP